MPQPHKIYINGRFLRGPITGTTRVAEEILAVWDARLSTDASLRDRFQMRLLRPVRRMRDLQLTHIPQTDVHLVGGKLWELLDLPLAARDGVLVNFANIAPFIHRRGVVYVHDTQIYLYPESYPFKERTLHKLLGWLGAHAACRVITISAFSASMLERYRLAKREKISIIHNGADHILRAPEDPSVLDRFGFAPRGYVLMFGSGFAYKNNRIVYEAIRRLGPQAPHLAVIGRADERSAFESIIDQRAGKVTLVSGLSDGALRALYANALVFVAPSRTEGYPITPLEALNCGCPVITTPEGSMPEVLGDAVDYAGADDADAWANAIMAYVRDPGRRAIVVSKGQPVAASKTWARAADTLLDEVARLCAD
jgi:glycosyltransferase involved in cell wall biosynthesis